MFQVYHSRYSGCCLGIWGHDFALVYCSARISEGYINPAVIFELLLARKLSLTLVVYYFVMQCIGVVCVGPGW
ncbi:hypothetical protein CRG98_022047 [Punica granatum]|uniref:Uncharacterized protein n=1 Tax=Punica granatum TaxID=22663 RepID=A0A2I0JQ14_PUNGR|nr:hypothetical protein CRG98_022047 [Punica granatum]